jgi:hypothetical protein
MHKLDVVVRLQSIPRLGVGYVQVFHSISKQALRRIHIPGPHLGCNPIDTS